MPHKLRSYPCIPHPCFVPDVLNESRESLAYFMHEIETKVSCTLSGTDRALRGHNGPRRECAGLRHYPLHVKTPQGGPAF